MEMMMMMMMVIIADFFAAALHQERPGVQSECEMLQNFLSIHYQVITEPDVDINQYQPQYFIRGSITYYQIKLSMFFYIYFQK